MNQGWSRREFLGRTGAAALGLSLLSLRPQRARAGTATASSARASGAHGPARQGLPAYRSWEDVYRERWRWERVVKCTHLRSNCISACAWNVFVKEGIAWREEQAAVYRPTSPDLPDFNPRGCQKGACYAALMYEPSRLRYPLKRVGPRGAGRWRRISWDEALDEVADAIIEACLVEGPETIAYVGGTTNVDFGPDTAAEMRFINLLGATLIDSNGAGVGDAALGAAETWGVSFVDGTADDWLHARTLIVWCMNPSVTRIPEAHFLNEARYRGTRITVIAPDYNPTAMHADLWVNPRVGTDAALALAMAEVIVREGLYAEAYIKEQTDLPLLVREDTGRLLRERDLIDGGRENVFYLWDRTAGRAERAPGSQDLWHTSLALGSRDPALDGRYEVTLADGRRVSVRPVMEFLRERLAQYRPERAAAVTGVAATVIEGLAREFARAPAAAIVASFGNCKHYHSDLVQRALILLCALTGNQGRRGGGMRIAAWWTLEGFEALSSAHELPWYASLAMRFYRPSARYLEGYITDFMRSATTFTPALLWLYVHGGLDQLDHPEGREAVAARVRESILRGWMPIHPRPGQQPRVLLVTGGNPLRRWPVPLHIERHLWPKLKLIVSVNFRLSTTALKSDIVLPAAAYYEKRGVKYAQSYLPYVVVGDKAVEPLGEALAEWELFGRLARRIQERARERGVGKYRGTIGPERDLGTFYDQWSENGVLGEKEETAALERILSGSDATRVSWAEAARRGAVPLKATGRYSPVNGVCSDLEPGKTVAPSRWFVEGKEPWPTLTGRQQFYLDHPWYLEAGEELPVYKEQPRAGGAYPLRLTGGHTRWSIHAIWRDQRYLLRLQRGGPVAYLSPADARRRGIADHDLVRLFNDAGSSVVRAKISPAVQPGQVIVYHAWEPYQFPRWESAQEVVPAPFKPLALAGGYGQLHFRTGLMAPGYAPRGMAVEVEKVSPPA